MLIPAFASPPATVTAGGDAKGKKELSAAVTGPLIVDDLRLAIQGALDGIGMASVDEAEVAAYLWDGRLVQMLHDWYQPYPGSFLYYQAVPNNRQRSRLLSERFAPLAVINHDMSAYRHQSAC